MTDPAADDPGPAPGEPRASAPPRSPLAGRLLLAALAVYAGLVLLAAYAQLTDNRPLLDLFDVRRWFTR